MAMPTEGEQTELWVMRPSGRAVAMGSSQKPATFAADELDRDGIELAERRSGGGAVFIDPAGIVWIDVLAPRSSRLWHRDLVQNFLIVGHLWQHALAELGVVTEIVTESPDRTPASSLACWAGHGWGELVIGDAKLVGLSQRRTRWGSRVQAMAVVDASAAQVAHYLAAEHRRAVDGAIPAPPTTVELRPDVLEAAVIETFTNFIDHN
jgi:lipoate-protein ligase A